MHKAPPHITARLQACRTRIQQKGLDGYLVTRRTDQYYLTGFDGEDGAVLLLPRQVILVTDGRFREAAARTAPWAKAIIREDTLAKTVARLLKRHRLERIGFDPDHLTVRQHAGFRKEIRPARLVSLPGVTEQLRLIKDETEVTALREAIRIAESAFRTVIRQLRPGTTERQLAAALLFEMQREGAEGASFPIIVAEGPNSSLPHAVPGDRPIKRGSAVLIDWGAVYRGYCSDLTRVVFIHRIPPRFRRLYEHVPLEKLRLVARALGGIQRHCRDRLVISYITAADFEATGAGEEMTEGVIDHLRSIDGAKVAAVVRDLGERGRAARKVSLRSSEGDVDVSAIARVNGGGGHKRAAGFSTDLELDDLVRFLCDQVVAQLGE